MLSTDVHLRLDDFVTRATRIFMSNGYKRSKMSDVTTAMGLSEGAIYRYFESKEALFDLVLRQAADPTTSIAVAGLPVRTPAPGATLDFLRRALDERARFDSLEHALLRPAGRERMGLELEAIVREIYRRSFHFRTGLRLIERCAMDWPEIAELWFGGRRRALLEKLAAYFDDRIRRGWLRPVPSSQAVAMLIFEEAAFFTMHRHLDPWRFEIDDDVAEATMVDNIVNAYLPHNP